MESCWLPGSHRDNDPLARALDDVDLDHDVAIVADAVEINKVDGIDPLVSLDANLTPTEQSRAINARIREVEGPDQELRVMEPEDLDMDN